jgi:hypothetical protein
VRARWVRRKRPLQGAATLSWSRYGSTRAKLPEVAARLQGSGELLLTGGRPAEARAAARLLGVLNRWSAAPILPTPAPADRLAPSTSGAYQLVVGAPPSSAAQLNLPLDVQPSLNIATRETHRSVLAGRPDRSFIAIEYLSHGPPMLTVITPPDTDDGVLDTTLARLTAPATFASLDGNVVLAGTDDQVVVDLTSAGLIAGATEEPGWLELLAANRWVLLVPVGVLIILFWVGVYRGVGQPPPPAVPPDNAPPGTTA